MQFSSLVTFGEYVWMHRGVFRSHVNVCMTFICGGQRITLGIIPQEFFTLL